MLKRDIIRVPKGIVHIGLTNLRRRKTLITRLLLILLIFPLFLQIFFAYFVGNEASLAPLGLQQTKNLMIVTAHPDDECLFFSPGILGIRQAYPHIRASLLCLSTGNNYGKGEVRATELEGSCKALGIEQRDCVALDHKDLQDSPGVWWNETIIEEVIKHHATINSIDAILTFDDGGVSGHINHRAVSSAIKHYINHDQTAPQAFFLTTTSLLRKYTFLWDLPLSTMIFTYRNTVSKSSDAIIHRRYRPEGLAVSTWAQYLSTRSAFASHASQYSWDRHLYMFWSRYVWFNSIRRVQ